MADDYVPPRGTGAPKYAIEKFAENVAQALSFKPGASIEELVKSTGGKIVIGSTGSEDFQSGSIIARALDDYTIYLSRNTSRLRDRFTIAHEIGHLTLHFPKLKEENPNAIMRATRWVDEADQAQKRAEWEANWFAAAFLMPAEPFKSAFAKGGIDYAQLVFDVSPSAASTRAQVLNLLG